MLYLKLHCAFKSVLTAIFSSNEHNASKQVCPILTTCPNSRGGCTNNSITLSKITGKNLTIVSGFAPDRPNIADLKEKTLTELKEGKGKI